MLSLVAIFTEERSIFDCLHNLALAASNPLNVKQQPTMNVMMGSNLGTSNGDNDMPPLIRGTTTRAATSSLDALDVNVDVDLPMPGPLVEIEMATFDDVVGTGKQLSPRSVTLSTHRNVTILSPRTVTLD